MQTSVKKWHLDICLFHKYPQQVCLNGLLHDSRVPPLISSFVILRGSWMAQSSASGTWDVRSRMRLVQTAHESPGREGSVEKKRLESALSRTWTMFSMSIGKWGRENQQSSIFSANKGINYCRKMIVSEKNILRKNILKYLLNVILCRHHLWLNV